MPDAKSYRRLQGPQRHYDLAAYEPLLPGTPAKPVAAFIHGLEEGWQIWEPLARGLSRRLRSFCLDLPWSGRNRYDWAHETRVRWWIDRGLRLLPRPVSIVVAHSFGANAVLEHFDARGVGGVEALVLVSPFYRGRAEFSWPLFDHYMGNFERFVAAGIEVYRSSRRVPAASDAVLARKVLDRIGPVGCLQFLNLFARTPRLDPRRLDLPVLVLGGEEDFYSLPVDCEALVRALPRAELRLLPRCGHFAMIEQPGILCSLIQEFVSRSLGSDLRTRREDQRCLFA
jgi:pimeloyl-ACP methyl ester carboxylesterase